MLISEVTENLSSVKTLTPKELSDKHNVSVTDILKQLQLGIEMEGEHTKNKSMAREIALDHLAEMPDYYTKLQKMELGEGVGIITKQNTTVDVKPGETTRQANKFNLELDKNGRPKLLRP